MSKSINAVPLRYVEHKFAGARGGSNIYVAHGLLGNAMNWATAAKQLGRHPMLAPKLNSIYCLDMRNHGASPHSDSHVNSALASDVERVVLEGQRRLHQTKAPAGGAGSILIGHSMGGLTLIGSLLRRYNEAALLPLRDSEAAIRQAYPGADAAAPVFGHWDAHRRAGCQQSMRAVNELFDFAETQPIEQVLFDDPARSQQQRSANIASRIPALGRIRAAVIVDITPHRPTLHATAGQKEEKAPSTYETLEQMTLVDLGVIQTYDDAHKELLRVGMKDKAMRDFVTTNIQFTERGSDGSRAASWKCNLEVLFKQFGQFMPSIVDWFPSAEAAGPQPLPPPEPCSLPVLFVFGEKSPHNDAANRARLSQYFTQLEQVEVKGAGHFVHYEKTKEFVEVVAPFVNKYM